MVKIQVELRAASRYSLSANVVFSWQEERGVRLKGEGITRDMSTKGVFVYSVVLPPERAPITMEVAFPPLREGASPVRIHLHGQVMRVESYPADPVHNGFAVASESTILRGGESLGSSEEEGR